MNKVIEKQTNLTEVGVMKNTIVKLISLVVAFVFSCNVTVVAETISVGVNNVSAIYDYSNFAANGSFTSVKDLVNNKETRVYANARITGHYGTDSSFIKETQSLLNGNGVVTQTDDLINNTHQKFNETGQITRAWSVAPDGKTAYDADINYKSNGDYSIAWKGEFYDTATGQKTGTGVKSVENYAASGKILSSVSYDKDGSESGKTTYNYNTAGNSLVNVTTYAKKTECPNSGWQPASITYYEAGRAVSAKSYNYSDTGAATTYTSAVYNYSGAKLDSVNNYKLEGGQTILDSRTTFDKFGRKANTYDNQGRLISKTFYNDTNTPQSQTLNYKDSSGASKSLSVNVVAGGILKSEDYVYNDTTSTPNSSTVKSTSTTLYWGGSGNTPAITASNL